MERQKKKIFAVSDIHGHASLLKEALLCSGFEKGNPEHLLIVLGDLFDRGSENRATLEFLVGIENKIIIRGNHEGILTEALESGLVGNRQINNGTLSTLFEFFPNYSGGKFFIPQNEEEKRTRDMLLKFIGGFVDYYETENYIFTHGWLPQNFGEILPNWREATEEEWYTARWSRWPNFYTSFEIPDGKTLVVGHTPVSYYARGFDPSRHAGCADIFYGERLVAIDAGTVDTGKINVFVTEDYLI